jgi:hypothetical protein
VLSSQSRLWGFWLRPPGWRGRMHNIALLLQPIALLQPITLLRRIRLLKGTAAEPTVELTVHLPVKPTAVTSTPRALVRRPMPLLLKLMPLKRSARGNGTPVPARVNEAVCASPTSISIAVTATKPHARLRSADPTRAGHSLVIRVGTGNRPLGTPPGGLSNANLPAHGVIVG